MKKRGAMFKQRTKACPTLVKISFGEGVDFEVMTYTAIESLIGGWATHEHVTHLHDLANTVIIVGSTKDDKNAITAGRQVRDVVKAAAARFKKVGKFGINGDELKVLRKFAQFVPGFYKLTSGETVEQAERFVTKIKQESIREAA